MTTWLDQVVSELRVAAGLSSFDLALVANVVIPPASTSEVLPAPTFRERLESGFAAARLTSDTPQRISLLRSILDVLAPSAGPAFANSWMADLHSRVEADLAVENGHDRNYAQLRARALARAAVFERRAEVRSLGECRQWCSTRTAGCSRRATADVARCWRRSTCKLDAARRLRLEQDAWALRGTSSSQYWRDVRRRSRSMLGVREWLTAVRISRTVARCAAPAVPAGAAAKREWSRCRPRPKSPPRIRRWPRAAWRCARPRRVRRGAVRQHGHCLGSGVRRGRGPDAA